MRIEIIRLHDGIPLPTFARPGDAGVDLRARLSCALLPGQRAKIPTGIAVAIPPGYAGFIQPKSGLANRHGLSIVNTPGLVDSGFRGEIMVLTINLGHDEVMIRRLDQIAQLVIVPVPAVEYVEVSELPSSERGEAGFGSTGTN